MMGKIELANVLNISGLGINIKIIPIIYAYYLVIVFYYLIRFLGYATIIFIVEVVSVLLTVV